MILQIIPIAEASTATLMASINRVIINPLIGFLMALAVAYFIYGVVRYLLSPENEEIRKTSKSQMLWGIIGLFIMISVFGIMNFILNSLGEPSLSLSILESSAIV
jgi:predicted PurR-regulated permease PerM